MKKSIISLSLIFGIVLLFTFCKKREPPVPIPVPTPPHSKVTFQGSTVLLTDSCGPVYNDPNYIMEGLSSTYSVFVRLKNGKPAKNTSINFPSANVDFFIGNGGAVWGSATAGTGTFTVNGTHVTFTFNNVTFLESNTTNTALASGVLNCDN